MPAPGSITPSRKVNSLWSLQAPLRVRVWFRPPLKLFDEGRKAVGEGGEESGGKGTGGSLHGCDFFTTTTMRCVVGALGSAASVYCIQKWSLYSAG